MSHHHVRLYTASSGEEHGVGGGAELTGGILVLSDGATKAQIADLGSPILTQQDVGTAAQAPRQKSYDACWNSRSTASHALLYLCTIFIQVFIETAQEVLAQLAVPFDVQV